MLKGQLDKTMVSKPGMSSTKPVKSPTQMKGQLDKSSASAEKIMDSMKKMSTSMKGQKS